MRCSSPAPCRPGMGEACGYSVRATRRTTPRSQRWAGTSSSLRCHSIAVSRRGEANGSRMTSRGAARANARAVRAP